MPKQYRYELKFTLSSLDAELLKRQLLFVCKLDSHSLSKTCSYFIRSLYFDDVLSSAYHDKVNGESRRRKYRIRMYNQNPDTLKLECKFKDGFMTLKEEQAIDVETCKHLINREYTAVEYPQGLLYRFICEAKAYGLRPSVIVDYRRLAYVYPVSTVRITFDEDIRSGKYSNDIFSEKLQTQKVIDEDCVEIEVKFNDFMPEHILGILNSVPKCRMALSKYALSYAVK